MTQFVSDVSTLDVPEVAHALPESATLSVRRRLDEQQADARHVRLCPDRSREQHAAEGAQRSERQSSTPMLHKIGS